MFILPGRRTRESLHVKIAHQQNQRYLPNALTAISIILYILKIAGTFHFFLSVQTWCVYNHKTMTINECITGAVLISILYYFAMSSCKPRPAAQLNTFLDLCITFLDDWSKTHMRYNVNRHAE